MSDDDLTADQVNFLRERAAATRRRWLLHALDDVLKRFPNDPDLLALKGSLGDTLTDEEVLRLLKDWNETGKVIHERQ